ncbi:endo alpha-1,4 polygalactosaminidase [Marinobacter sp. HN1S83]|uniref:endo alpha-1,4 polygalactosaminidase n=1 Tax=Marinobacter sp. HN1S83 TaxID=3382301 RepID=UPI00387B5A20
MSRTCLLFITLLASSFGFSAPSTPHNVAFYYGDEAPIGSLYAYDWVVLQQDRTSDARLDLLDKGGTRPLTYISIGEMARSHRYYRQLKDHWKLGKNTAWQSSVLDINNPAVQQFILDKLVAPAMERGFQGVFMDTLDSHLLTDQGKEDPASFAESQARLIRAIKQRYPSARLIANRGFHLPESVHPLIDALAFESWRNGYDASRNQYTIVSDNDREWLGGQLTHWREEHPAVPLIAIDYAGRGDNADDQARRLREEGFIPYISNGALNRLGPTQPATVKRHVLVIHDLPTERMDQSAAHRRLGIILERLGLVPVYRSAQEPHPQEPLEDRYAGVVIWWETGNRSSDLCQWLGGRQSPTMPVITFGQAPVETACRTLLKTTRLAVPEAPLSFNSLHPSVGQYEGGRLPTAPTSPLPAMQSSTTWITATGHDGRKFHPVYTFDSGGAALDPFVLEHGPDDQAFWLFNPFEFLREALRLGTFPAIDSTTESGRRILTAHIDGDGLISRAEFPGSPLSAEVIRKQILKQFPLPHTVSVIEAETSPQGLYPDVSGEAEALARQMFEMDNVEVASHTYSHPFFWQILEGGPAPDLEFTQYGYSMNVPDYNANLDREIDGSVSYINDRLTPPDKPVSVFLWTGDARPGKRALAKVRELGLININGGDTHPMPYDSELAGVWPDARPVGDELQVYAPVMNENVYTNLWTGPFYGFRNVIDSFEILEAKGRLKPVGIYYHFYSGTRSESLNALKEVYQYARGQSVTPLFLSDYAKRVQSQYYSAMTVTGDGGYQWRGIGSPSTVRISRDRFPDLARSKGVAGYNDVAEQRFVHLVGAEPMLHLSPAPTKGPYVESANAVITEWQRNQASGKWLLKIALQGHQPVSLRLAGADHCKITNKAPVQQSRDADAKRLVFSSAANHRIRLELECS